MSTFTAVSFALWAGFGLLALAPMIAISLVPRFRRWVGPRGSDRWEVCRRWSLSMFVALAAACAAFVAS